MAAGKADMVVTARMKDLLSKSFKKTGKTVVTGAHKMDTAMTKVKKTMKETQDRVFTLKGAIAGLGLALAARQVYRYASAFVTAGAQLEDFRNQLTAVMDGSEQMADSTLKWVRDFAAATPHMTSDVISSFIQLKAVGIDAGVGMMTAIGDASYLFNRNIQDVSTALVGLEAEVLRRLGIQLDRTGKKAVIMSGKMRIETDKSAKSVREGIIKVWETRFPGAMKKAETSWNGMIALLKSQWWEFQAAVMDAGVMEGLKEGIGDIITELNRWAKDGSLKKWIKDLASTAIAGISAMNSSLQFMYGTVNKLQSAWAIASNAFGKGSKLYFDNARKNQKFWHDEMSKLVKQKNALLREARIITFAAGKATTQSLKKGTLEAIASIEKEISIAADKVQMYGERLDKSLDASQGIRRTVLGLADAQDKADKFFGGLKTKLAKIGKAVEGDGVVGTGGLGLLMGKQLSGMSDMLKTMGPTVVSEAEIFADEMQAALKRFVAGGGLTAMPQEKRKVDVDFDFSKQSMFDAYDKLQRTVRTGGWAVEVDIKGDYPAWYKALLADAPKSVEDTNSALTEQVAIWDDIAGEAAKAARQQAKTNAAMRNLINLGGQFVTQVLDAALNKAEDLEHTLYKAAISLAVQVGGALLQAAVAAKGAVWEGGFTPIHAFAGGGMVQARSPVMGIIGEGQRDEAIIPMENGAVRAVIDSPKGGGETTIINNITIQGDMIDPEQWFMKNRDSLLSASAANREENPHA